MRLTTKIFVCVVGVLSNVGIWGDISIDTVLAQNYGYNSKTSESKNCARQCKFGQKPKTCIFDFKIEPSLVRNRSALAINGLIPGPSIEVCVKDIIVVDVKNQLPGQELALHWRGVSQKGSPYMDGVPMVTQCPIASGTSFRYTFRADDAGTHFYHAHSVQHQQRGIFGALIIRQPAPLEPATAFFGRGRAIEEVFIVSTGTSGYQPTHIEVDGHTGNGDDVRKLQVVKDQSYRIRIINAIPLDCPVSVSAAKHQITALSSDGRAVKPKTLKSLVLLPGERFDFMLKADQDPAIYVMKIQGMSLCKDLVHKALISYEGNDTENDAIGDEDEKSQKGKLIYGQQLESASSPPAELTVSPISQSTVFLKVDVNTVKVSDDENDYRYLSDAMPVPPFYPAELSKDDSSTVVQINGKNFLYPNAPILSQPNDLIKRTVCPVGREKKTKGVECVQILEVDYKSTLELIIVDEGFGGDSTKTFHIHGNPMYVLATSKSYQKGLTREQAEEMDGQGKIKRNLWNPPLKDTIYIPNKGFVVVRIIADNPGAWLLECRSCGMSSLPTGLVIRIRSKLPSKILKTLPKCGNFRPPDTLIN